MRGPIVTQLNFEPSPGPAHNPRFSNTGITEVDGYRSAEDQVLELIAAGERLDRYRRDEYDVPGDDLETVDLPVGRSRDFDAATASQALEFEARRIASLPPNAQVAPAIAAAAEARVAEAK